MAKRIIEYLNGTTKLTSPILMHITLNSIPKTKNTAVADKAPKISIEGVNLGRAACVTKKITEECASKPGIYSLI